MVTRLRSMKPKLRVSLTCCINWQFCQECRVMQSAKAIDIMVDTWIAMMPLRDFVTNGK